MKKWILLTLGAIAIFSIILILNSFTTTGNTVSENTDEVTLSYKNRNYALSDTTFKVGEPVTITVDDSVKGCYKSIVIPELGINKYVTSSDNEIIFTPTEPGTYTLRCSMGMGKIKFTVE